MALFDGEEAPLRPRRSQSRGRTRRIVGSVVTFAVLAGVALAGAAIISNPRPLIDQVTVWQFEPDAVIAGHVTRLGLTYHGRFLYYASRPVVSGAAEFSEECPHDEAESEYGILGCYLPADKTIFLFDVTDVRLDGAEEVVAAHEMLHAAWDRLGDDERGHLATLLEAEAKKLEVEPAFAARMEFYDRTEPGERANELHSIIGTETADVSDELEQYYSRYFVDRSVVTGLYAGWHTVFNELKLKGDTIVAEMEDIRLSTETDYDIYSAGYEALNSDIAVFNERAESGYYSSTAQFNTARAKLVERGNTLDALFASVQERAERYRVLEAELKTVNETSAELQRGLNIGGEATGTPGL